MKETHDKRLSLVELAVLQDEVTKLLEAEQTRHAGVLEKLTEDEQRYGREAERLTALIDRIIEKKIVHVVPNGGGQWPFTLYGPGELPDATWQLVHLPCRMLERDALKLVAPDVLEKLAGGPPPMARAVPGSNGRWLYVEGGEQIEVYVAKQLARVETLCVKALPRHAVVTRPSVTGSTYFEYQLEPAVVSRMAFEVKPADDTVL